MSDLYVVAVLFYPICCIAKWQRLGAHRGRHVLLPESKLQALLHQIEPYRDKYNILVYCGSASLQDYTRDKLEVYEEEIRQIDAVTDMLGNKVGMRVSQFTSKENAEKREHLKNEFASGENLQALIAIKCLDEGVNIPGIRTAFILASTTNPKEYIQRRGRVLRKADNKPFAAHSWYFRNACVRANYNNIKKGVYETTKYLELFLRNLLVLPLHKMYFQVL